MVNKLADHNLLLLRRIYDAYNERGDKVLNKFRSDNNNVLRKRYLKPILNPNYPADELQKDLAEKNGLKEKEEGESVMLDGISIQEEEEQAVMEGQEEECKKDLIKPKQNR
jgi:hypothetical protein